MQSYWQKTAARRSTRSPNTIRDAAILDINMPELDGYAVCQQLDYINSRMPVIFLTGVEANAVKILGDRMGAYLAKPVCGERLVQAVRDVLQVA